MGRLVTKIPGAGRSVAAAVVNLCNDDRTEEELTYRAESQVEEKARSRA